MAAFRCGMLLCVLGVALCDTSPPPGWRIPDVEPSPFSQEAAMVDVQWPLLKQVASVFTTGSIDTTLMTLPFARLAAAWQRVLAGAPSRPPAPAAAVSSANNGSNVLPVAVLPPAFDGGVLGPVPLSLLVQMYVSDTGASRSAASLAAAFDWASSAATAAHSFCAPPPLPSPTPVVVAPQSAAAGRGAAWAPPAPPVTVAAPAATGAYGYSAKTTGSVAAPITVSTGSAAVPAAFSSATTAGAAAVAAAPAPVAAYGSASGPASSASGPAPSSGRVVSSFVASGSGAAAGGSGPATASPAPPDPESTRVLIERVLAALYPPASSLASGASPPPLPASLPRRRPFLVHGGERIRSGPGPILVLGSGAGHLALRLADALPNATVLGVGWKPQSSIFTAQLDPSLLDWGWDGASSAASGTWTGPNIVSPADIHAALAAELGLPNALAVGGSCGAGAAGSILDVEPAEGLGTFVSAILPRLLPWDVDDARKGAPVPLPAAPPPASASASPAAKPAVFALPATSLAKASPSSAAAPFALVADYDGDKDDGGSADDDDDCGLWASVPHGAFRLAAVVVPDLRRYAEAPLLPHEFAASLGGLLRLSRHIVLPAVLPGSPRLFGYWRDAQALVSDAAASVGLVATTFILPPWKASPSGQGSGAPASTLGTQSSAPWSGVGKGPAASMETRWLLVSLQTSAEADAEVWLYKHVREFTDVSTGAEPTAAQRASDPLCTGVLPGSMNAAPAASGAGTPVGERGSAMRSRPDFGSLQYDGRVYSGVAGSAAATRLGLPLDLLLALGLPRQTRQSVTVQLAATDVPLQLLALAGAAAVSTGVVADVPPVERGGGQHAPLFTAVPPSWIYALPWGASAPSGLQSAAAGGTLSHPPALALVVPDAVMPALLDSATPGGERFPDTKGGTGTDGAKGLAIGPPAVRPGTTSAAAMEAEFRHIHALHTRHRSAAAKVPPVVSGVDGTQVAGAGSVLFSRRAGSNAGAGDSNPAPLAASTLLDGRSGTVATTAFGQPKVTSVTEPATSPIAAGATGGRGSSAVSAAAALPSLTVPASIATAPASPPLPALGRSVTVGDSASSAGAARRLDSRPAGPSTEGSADAFVGSLLESAAPPPGPATMPRPGPAYNAAAATADLGVAAAPVVAPGLSSAAGTTPPATVGLQTAHAHPAGSTGDPSLEKAHDVLGGPPPPHISAVQPGGGVANKAVAASSDTALPASPFSSAGAALPPAANPAITAEVTQRGGAGVSAGTVPAVGRHSSVADPPGTGPSDPAVDTAPQQPHRRRRIETAAAADGAVDSSTVRARRRHAPGDTPPSPADGDAEQAAEARGQGRRLLAFGQSDSPVIRVPSDPQQETVGAAAARSVSAASSTVSSLAPSFSTPGTSEKGPVPWAVLRPLVRPASSSAAASASQGKGVSSSSGIGGSKDPAEPWALSGSALQLAAAAAAAVTATSATGRMAAPATPVRPAAPLRSAAPAGWADADGGRPQAALVGSEARPFKQWWSLLLPLPPASTDTAAAVPWTALVGGERLGLLASKLALAFPAAQVVAALPSLAAVEPHADLLRLLAVPNCLLTVAEMTPARLKALAAPSLLAQRSAAAATASRSHPFSVAVFSADAFAGGLADDAVAAIEAAALGAPASPAAVQAAVEEAWAERLGAFLLAAPAVWLQLPPWPRVASSVYASVQAPQAGPSSCSWDGTAEATGVDFSVSPWWWTGARSGGGSSSGAAPSSDDLESGTDGGASTVSRSPAFDMLALDEGDTEVPASSSSASPAKPTEDAAGAIDREDGEGDADGGDDPPDPDWYANLFGGGAVEPVAASGDGDALQPRQQQRKLLEATQLRGGYSGLPAATPVTGLRAPPPPPPHAEPGVGPQPLPAAGTPFVAPAPAHVWAPSAASSAYAQPAAPVTAGAGGAVAATSAILGGKAAPGGAASVPGAAAAPRPHSLAIGVAATRSPRPLAAAHRTTAAAGSRCSALRGAQAVPQLAAAVLRGIGASAATAVPPTSGGSASGVRGACGAQAESQWLLLPGPGAPFPPLPASAPPSLVRIGVDLRSSGGGRNSSSSSSSSPTPPAWLAQLFAPWARTLCAAAARAAAFRPDSAASSPTCIRVVVRPRLLSPDGGGLAAVALIDGCGPALPVASGRAAKAPAASLQAPVPLGLGASAAASTALPPARPLSLHTLLALGALPGLRARLFRMFLSLPLPAVVRAAQRAQGLLESRRGAADAGHAAAQEPPFAPWAVLLAPDPHPLCGARLVVSVPDGGGSSGPPTTFPSRLCLLTQAAGGAPDEGDSTGGDVEADAAMAAATLAAGAAGSGSGAALPPPLSPYDVHLAEMWSALASQLPPLDTAPGVANASELLQRLPLGVPPGVAATGGYVHASGRFSMIAHAVGSGALPLLLARAFPHATLLSLDDDAASADAHLAAALRSGAANDIIGRAPFDTSTVANFAGSPEFARFQLVNVDALSLLLTPAPLGSGAPPPPSPSLFGLGSAPVYGGIERAGYSLAAAFELAATTFVRAPPAALLSLAYTTFADTEAYPSPATPWVAAAPSVPGDGTCWASAFIADPAGDAAAFARLSRPASPSAPGGLCGGLAAPTAAAFPSLGGTQSLAAPALTLRRLAAPWSPAHHPRVPFADAETRLVSGFVKAALLASGKGGAPTVRVAVAPVPAAASLDGGVDGIAPPATPLSRLSLASTVAAARSAGGSGSAHLPAPSDWSTPVLQPFPRVSSGLLRVDLGGLTRHVNHHFQSEIDGHTRKYTLHVHRNVTAGALLALAPGGAPVTVGAVYALLPPGNHPNHGFTQTCGQAQAPLLAALDEARARAEARRRAAASSPSPRPSVATGSGRGSPAAASADAIEAAFADADLEVYVLAKAPQSPGAVVCGPSSPFYAAHARYAALWAAQEGQRAALRSAAAAVVSTGGSSGDGDSAAARAASASALTAASAAAAKQATSAGSSGSAQLPAWQLPRPPPPLLPSAATVIPGVTSVILTRDMDDAFIPYETLQSFTLITGLRLGLLAPLRARAYHQFVALPLYQDMAPWNIVFSGPRLDYIDYDTRDHTYDAVVPRAYEVMEVLFNYKRTVEDFKKCAGKGSNPYGFPFVSECVGGGAFAGPCKDTARPVPCGDGSCQSDYVACLRSISAAEAPRDARAASKWAVRERAEARAARGGSGAAAVVLQPAAMGEPAAGDTLPDAEEEEEGRAAGGALAAAAAAVAGGGAIPELEY